MLAPARSISFRLLVTLAIAVLVATVLQVVQVASAPSAGADPVPGGGRFVSLAQSKIVDTRDGTGGVPAAPVTSGGEIVFPVAGHGGVPTGNVSAVMVNLSAVTPSGLGYVRAFPNGSPIPDVTHLSYDTTEMQSNTAIVQLGPDGAMRLWNSGGPTHLLVSVEGFFTQPTGAPGDAGGFVPVTQNRIFDTRDPAGPHPAPMVDNETVTVDTANVGGIAADADAAIVAVSAIGPVGAGHAFVWESGAPIPDAGSLIWDTSGSSITTTLTVPIGADGKIAINTHVISTDIAVDVQGYFSSNASEGSGLTLTEARLADTRPTSTPLAADATMTVAVAGTNGLPATGIAGAVLNITGTQATADGGLVVWRTGGQEPIAPTVQFSDGAQRTNLVIVPPGSDGTISIHNTSADPVHVVVDLHGWFATPPPRLGVTGWMTTIDRTITDKTNLSVNVATGNALLSTTDFSIPGTGVASSVSHYYNSRSEEAGSLPVGWNLSVGQDVAIDIAFDSAVLFQTADGGMEVFQPTPGAVSYVTPPGVNATLANGPSSGTWDLTFHGSRTRFHYDALGGTGKAYLTAVVDRNGNQITYTYNTAHQLTTITDTQGRTITLTYTGAGFVDTITDTAAARTVVFGYTGDQLTTVTDAAGETMTYGYTGTELTSITDPEGNVTELTYATIAGPHTVVELVDGAGSPDEATTQFQYTDAPTTVVVDDNGQGTTYATDGLGRVISVSDPNGHTQSASWTGNNAAAAVTDDTLSATYTMSYDTLNNLTSVQAPDTGSGGAGGRSMQLGYPAPSSSSADYQATSMTDAQGNATTYAYDPAGNPTTATPPAGAGGPIANSYQGSPGIDCGAHVGQLCSTSDGAGNTTSYGYDAAGNVTSMTPPAPLGDTTVTPDPVSRPSTVVDGNDVEVGYTYDALDRVTQITYDTSSCDPAAGNCITYEYDGSGNLVERVDNTGTTTWAFDAQNRPVSKTLPGNIVSEVTYDGVGNVLTYTDPAGTITYTYDAANNLSNLAEPGGSCPTGVVTPNSTKCTLFSYDEANRRTGIANPNGVTTIIDYDNNGRVATIEAVGPGGTAASAVYSYAHPSTGVDTALRHTTTISDSTTSYEYNALNQLVKATTGTIEQTWTYDAAGNRLTAAETGQPTVYYAYNTANQLCYTSTTAGGTCAAPPSGADIYTYDGNGNQLTGGGTTFTYNDKNQTATASDGTTTQTFTYADADSTELTSDGSTDYLNGLLGITQQSAGSTTVTATRDPDGALIGLRQGSSGSYDSLYYVLDAQASVLAQTDDTGATAASYTYDIFGATTSTGPAAASNPYTYASGLAQPSGLIKFGTRYYDPSIGRWTQHDPVSASLTNPAATNRYVYVDNNPTNFVDPSGRYYLLPDCWNLFFQCDPVYDWESAGDYVAETVGFAIGCAGGVAGTVKYMPLAYAWIGGPAALLMSSCLLGSAGVDLG